MTKHGITDMKWLDIVRRGMACDTNTWPDLALHYLKWVAWYCLKWVRKEMTWYDMGWHDVAWCDVYIYGMTAWHNITCHDITSQVMTSYYMTDLKRDRMKRHYASWDSMNQYMISLKQSQYWLLTKLIMIELRLPWMIDRQLPFRIWHQRDEFRL